MFSKFRVSGSGAAAFVDGLGANRAPARGRIGLIHALTPGGGVLSEFSVTCLADKNYYLVSAAAAQRQDEDLLRRRGRGFDIDIENLTHRRGVFGLMGPNAEVMLQKLCDADLSSAAFPWLQVRPIRVGNVDVDALRVSYVGETGFELHHALEDQSALLALLLDAGREFELGFYGALAMNSMRLEKGYRAWGADLTTERSPLEAGLDHLVKTDGRDFIGREAMLARAESDINWSMQLLEFNQPEFDPFYLHPILRDGEAVGIVTSGAYGHRLQKAIGLAYFCAAIDAADELEIEILGRRCGARITAPL